MAGAFQSNAFQNNAFQVDVTVSGSASSGLGAGGGGPWAPRGGRKRRSIDFEKMYEAIDETVSKNERERRQAFRRIEKAIEDAVNGVTEEAKEIEAPEPVAVVNTAAVIKKELVEALSASLNAKAKVTVDQNALRDRLEFMERQFRAVQRSHEIYLRAMEDDDEQVLLLASH